MKEDIFAGAILLALATWWAFVTLVAALFVLSIPGGIAFGLYLLATRL